MKAKARAVPEGLGRPRETASKECGSWADAENGMRREGGSPLSLPCPPANR